MNDFFVFLQMSAWVFGLGFAAAAPIGPVNMVAIHRGVVGKWSHTLSMGFGSAMVDLTYFTLTLWGGHRLYDYLRQPSVHEVLAIVGAIVLIPLGILFFIKMFRYNHHETQREKRRLRQAPPRHLWTDVGTGIALTIINPAVPIYWAGVGTPWLAAARASLPQLQSQSMTMMLGICGAGAGLLSWFCILSALVRFTPNRIGPRFFRVVNCLCGIMLVTFGAVCIRMAIKGLHG